MKNTGDTSFFLVDEVTKQYSVYTSQRDSEKMFSLYLHENISLTNLNPFMPRYPINGTLANSVDPDQTPQNVASDQGLHSLH